MTLEGNDSLPSSNGNGAPSSAAPSSSPITSPASAPVSSSPPAGVGGAGAPSAPPVGVGGIGATGTPSPAPFSNRDYLKSIGMDVSGFQDDKTVLENFISSWRNQQQQMAQLQQQAQLAQRYQPYQGMIDQYLANVQGVQGAQPKPGGRPEWNNAWRYMLQQDEQGNIVPRPGMPGDVVQKYQAAQQYQREMLDKLAFQGPVAAFGDEIKQMVQETAGQMLQQYMGQYQSQNLAQNLVNQHADWLYQKDAAGRPMQNPFTGAKMFSPQGQMYSKTAAMLEQAGIRDVAAQDSLARQLTAGQLAIDYYNQQQQQQQQAAAPPPAPLTPLQMNQQLQQQALAGASRLPNWGGTSLPATNPNAGIPPQNQKLPLNQMLQQAFVQHSITDRDFTPGRG